MLCAEVSGFLVEERDQNNLLKQDRPSAGSCDSDAGQGALGSLVLLKETSAQWWPHFENPLFNFRKTKKRQNREHFPLSGHAKNEESYSSPHRPLSTIIHLSSKIAAINDWVESTV